MMIKRVHLECVCGKIIKDKSSKRNLTNPKSIQAQVYYDCLDVITFYTDGEKYSKLMNL